MTKTSRCPNCMQPKHPYMSLRTFLRPKMQQHTERNLPGSWLQCVSHSRNLPNPLERKLQSSKLQNLDPMLKILRSICQEGKYHHPLLFHLSHPTQSQMRRATGTTKTSRCPNCMQTKHLQMSLKTFLPPKMQPHTQKNLACSWLRALSCPDQPQMRRVTGTTRTSKCSPNLMLLKHPQISPKNS